MSAPHQPVRRSASGNPPRPRTAHPPHLALVADDDAYPIASPAETCAEMCRALDQEIAAAKRQQLAKAVPVVVGSLDTRHDPYFIYALRLAHRVPPVRAEEPVLLRMGDRTEVPALVLSARGTMLRVAVSADLGLDVPPDTRVVFDSTWLLERLRSRLDQVREHLEAGRPATRFDPALAQMVVGHGVLPETAIEAEPHPAVLANATLAYNAAQERALRVAAGSPLTCVWGPPGTGKTRTAAAIIEHHLRSGRRTLVVTPSNAATDVITEALVRRLAGDPLLEAGAVLRVGPRPGTALRRAHGQHVVPQDIAARRAAAIYGPRLDEIATRLAELNALDQPTAETRDADRARQRETESLYVERAALQRGADAYQQMAFDRLLDRCRVLITPIANTYLSQQVRGSFDVTLIDEASMVSIPQAYLAAGLAKEQVVICGDFCQLPPPCEYNGSDALPWLTEDVFTRLGIPEDVARGDDPPYLVALHEQHRMTPDIATFVSDLFYLGRLTTPTTIARRPRTPWAVNPATLLYIDTGTLQPRAVVPPGTNSRANAIHAGMIADLVASMTDERAGSIAGSLLVLSPFAGQVERLHTALIPAVRALGLRDVAASSVHRAQGSEASTVVLTLDDALGAPLSQFMTARSWRDAGARLLNVAVSRARDRVVVVLDLEHLKRCAGPMVQAFVSALEQFGTAIPVEDVDGAWEERFGAPRP